MRKKIYMLATLAVALLMVSCEDDYKVYDTSAVAYYRHPCIADGYS